MSKRTRPSAKNATMTAADLVAARNLKAIWDRKKGALGLTQEKAGHLMGMTQGAVGHYLLGRAPLGVKAVLRFAQILQCDPLDIRDDLPELSALESQSVGTHAGMINARREALGLSVEEVHRRLIKQHWPSGIKPPSLQTVGAWFSGEDKPMDGRVLNALYAALEMDLEQAGKLAPMEPKTSASAEMLRLFEAKSPEEQLALLALLKVSSK